MTTCVILQPSYIPWVGVFQLMAQADVYIHYDDVQYDKLSWRNRNRLKFAEGMRWLTIPVSLPKGSVGSQIVDVQVADPRWNRRHQVLVREALGDAQFFHEVEQSLAAVLRPASYLVDVTIPALEELARILSLRPVFLRSSMMQGRGERTQRLVELCKEVSASRYLVGPAARSYLDESLFSDAGITVEWMDYPIRPYRQLHDPFDPYVSVLDPMANLGIVGTRGLLHPME